MVKPIVFPGGSIGELSVNGTVNDLAMCGARPLYLSSALIIEEGFPMEGLWQVVRSMRSAAASAGVTLVTGDTKVVDRGKGDGIFITTSGIGLIPPGVVIDPARARPGDRILLSGSIADHGIAIMSVREGLRFETTVRSDTAPLNGMVGAILEACPGIHVMRDPTRGGVASALNEIAAAASVGIRIEEERIPVVEEVRGACELLGFDPLYVANEGKMLAFVPREEAGAVLKIMRAPSPGPGRSRHRRGRSGAPRRGDHADPRRREQGRGHDVGRTAAEDLLMPFVILAVNPGSTSTKMAVYRDDQLLSAHVLRHDTADTGAIPGGMGSARLPAQPHPHMGPRACPFGIRRGGHRRSVAPAPGRNVPCEHPDA